MSIENYIEAEFRRYFPQALSIAVDFDDELEATNVAVTMPDIDAIWAWTCQAGSDDDYFLFRPQADAPEGLILTIPFMPETPENMNMRQFFEALFPAHDLEAPGGAGDGCSQGDILAEMPVESGCGDDCKACVDNAAALVGSIRLAYADDRPELIANVLNAAVETCLCYIRG